jgi:formate dehydrogenase iron-sulfur subunit
MVEVLTHSGRIAYGPVGKNDVADLFRSQWLDGGEHSLRLGPPEDIPYLKSQQRLIFARAGITDPLSLEDYLEHGGFRGLRAALAMPAQAIVEEVSNSGLRGRGGAAFPTGIKWKTVLAQPPGQKYVVCNADEGDSGSFSDRMLMEGDPFLLIEGMAIAALAVGADRGYIYLRSEYPYAYRTLERAIGTATARGHQARTSSSGKVFTSAAWGGRYSARNHAGSLRASVAWCVCRRFRRSKGCPAVRQITTSRRLLRCR